MVPKGEIDFHSLKRIAELSEHYGDKYVYTTNRQNFEIHGVDPERMPEIQAQAQVRAVRLRHRSAFPAARARSARAWIIW